MKPLWRDGLVLFLARIESNRMKIRQKYGFVDPAKKTSRRIVLRLSRFVEKPNVEDAPSDLAYYWTLYFNSWNFEAVQKNKNQELGKRSSIDTPIWSLNKTQKC